MKYQLVLTAFILFSTLGNAQPTTQIDVELRDTEPTPLQTSEYADIWLEVTNEGNTRANNVKIRFKENYPFSVDPGDRTLWNIGTLVPGEEYQVHLQVKVDENAVQGNNTLNFVTSTEGNIQIGDKVPVEVRSDNNILAVENISKPETIAPGAEGVMKLVFQNEADSYLKNIQISLDLSSSNLPVATKGSSAQNFQKLAPGEKFSAMFNLQVDPSAENGVYKIPVTLKYENEAGTEFKRSVTTALSVGGRPQLEVGITNEEVLQEGKNTVNLRIVNRGYGTAGFVKATLQKGENYRILSPETVYLGEMTSDDYQTAEFEIYVKESSSISMPVKLDYSHEGQKTVTETINANVYSQQQMRKYGLSSRGNLMPIGAVLILLVAGIWYWRRRRKE